MDVVIGRLIIPREASVALLTRVGTSSLMRLALALRQKALRSIPFALLLLAILPGQNSSLW
jgi:hypothetical protein